MNFPERFLTFRVPGVFYFISSDQRPPVIFTRCTCLNYLVLWWLSYLIWDSSSCNQAAAVSQIFIIDTRSLGLSCRSMVRNHRYWMGKQTADIVEWVVLYYGYLWILMGCKVSIAHWRPHQNALAAPIIKYSQTTFSMHFHRRWMHDDSNELNDFIHKVHKRTYKVCIAKRAMTLML